LANESFSYDQNGNRNASGQATSAGNEVQSDGTYNYSYDAAGNLVSKTSIATGVTTIDKWDYRNRLVEVDSVTGGVAAIVAVFTYDALNRQIGETDYPTGSTTTATPPAVGDAGFEAVSVGNGGYAYNPSGSPWTFTGGSGLSGNNSGFTSGDPAAPQGQQVAFLQYNGTISQAISGWNAGSYTISFDAIQRAGDNQDFQVLVDGNVVGTFQPTGSSYQLDSTPSFTVAAGSHTITFQGLDSAGGDNTAFLDAISVAAASSVAATYVGDPGFEAVPVGSGGGAYAYNPAGSAWTFTGQAGLSGNASAFTSANPNAPQGSQVAFLQSLGSIAQTIHVAVAGSYQLAFEAAQRGNNGTSAEDFQVLVDGTIVGTFRPTGTSYGWYGTPAFTLSAGTHTIAFQGLDSAGGDNTAFLDAVSLSGLTTPAPSGASAVRWTVDDGQTPLLDYNASGTVTARYLSVPGAIDELLARQTASGVAWYLDDREGSVKDLINNAGTVIDHVDYGAYGQVQAESAPAQGDRIKYAAMEFDAAIGFYYDRARFYDPTAGRFISPDPLGFLAGDADLYRSVANSPDNALDTSGLDGWGAAGGAVDGGLLGGGGGFLIGAGIGSIGGPPGALVGGLLGGAIGLIGGAYGGGMSGSSQTGFMNGTSSGLVPGAISAGVGGGAGGLVGAGLGPVIGPIGVGIRGGRRPRPAPRPQPRSCSGPTPRTDLPPLSGGRSGSNVKNLTGPPNSAIKGSDGRVFVTNDKGQVILDITKDRVKSVCPGQGFGPKQPPTQEQLDLINKIYGGS